eukprot:2693734-Pyramimonas_sp.AAC.1
MRTVPLPALLPTSPSAAFKAAMGFVPASFAFMYALTTCSSAITSLPSTWWVTQPNVLVNSDHRSSFEFQTRRVS